MLLTGISRIAGRAGQRATVQCRRAELSFFDHDPGAKLLDCGCRDGEFTLKKAARIGTKNIYGIEIMEGAAGIARKKGIEVCQCDLQQNFPFENESFDVVSVSQVIEHLSDTDGFLREVKRVLKKGGYTVISTPNLASLDAILLLLGGWQPGQVDVSDEVPAGVLRIGKGLIPHDEGPLHRRSFTGRALRELMEYHGFTVIKERGVGFYPFLFPIDKVFLLLSSIHASYIVIKAGKNQE
jgi:SAM-dependent methyltransferase